ncbi:HAD hydrolase-like protein [Saccharopolyspora shandongensis]|uniref:HAD hydrolase-like protein n=1 Tax=Saccharopolyspora shandongensis TaxID=418495 RepID=UPI00342A0414
MTRFVLWDIGLTLIDARGFGSRRYGRALADATGLTGTLAEVAFRKLESFELHHHIDFEIGGFGAASMHRRDLIPDSVAKTEDRHGKPISPDSVVVVGDTPHDFAGTRCASAAVAVGVATGSSREDDVHTAGAHAVLPTLADTDAMLAALS